MSTHWKRVVELVERQADDEALWAPVRTATEAYLQRALRSLHATIEEGTEEPEIERLAHLAYRMAAQG